MIYIAINDDQSIGAYFDCEAKDKAKCNASLCTGARLVQLDQLKLTNSQLPSGVSADTLHKLASLGFYFKETDDEYIFSLTKNEEEQ